MIPEPLTGKIHFMGDSEPFLFKEDDLKSAVEGLIKFYEDRIEELIQDIQKYFEKSIEEYEEDLSFNTVSLFVTYLEVIKREYESIMAIEYWLEDVI